MLIFLMRPTMRLLLLTLARLLTVVLVMSLLFADMTSSCGAGRGYGSRRSSKKMTPLVFREHVPNIAEHALGASGPSEGPIRRGKDLTGNRRQMYGLTEDRIADRGEFTAYVDESAEIRLSSARRKKKQHQPPVRSVMDSHKVPNEMKARPDAGLDTSRVIQGKSGKRQPTRGSGDRLVEPAKIEARIPSREKRTGEEVVDAVPRKKQRDRVISETLLTSEDLVVNNNPEILFKDEEGNGDDRVMSKRCKEKLNALAILVMTHWPGIRLRVTNAWIDPDSYEDHHFNSRDITGIPGLPERGTLHQSTTSLHFEGRAVDITTSDRDRTKYGMLARLAVIAGFDWVYYEERGHIHASVKSDSSAAAISTTGCFPGESTVRVLRPQLPADAQAGSLDGHMTYIPVVVNMSTLDVGDLVLSVDDFSGQIVVDVVVLFAHRSSTERIVMYIIETESGTRLTLSPGHLIYTSYYPLCSVLSNNVPSSMNQNFNLSLPDYSRVDYQSFNSPPFSMTSKFFYELFLHIIEKIYDFSSSIHSTLSYDVLSASLASLYSLVDCTSYSHMSNVKPFVSIQSLLSQNLSNPAFLVSRLQQFNDNNCNKINSAIRTMSSNAATTIIQKTTKSTKATDKHCLQHLRAKYASRVTPGHYVYVTDASTGDVVRPDRVTRVTLSHAESRKGHGAGVYAPITMRGTILVDNVMTSCYAHIKSHAVAHAALAPVRFAYHVANVLTSSGNNADRLTSGIVSMSQCKLEGVHWYARLLRTIGEYILPKNWWF